MGTLAARLKRAMQEADIRSADLARACAITSASVSDWLTGKTKSLRGLSLMRAAIALDVNEMWLAEGRGPMRGNNRVAEGNVPNYGAEGQSSAFIIARGSAHAELLDAFDALPPAKRRALLELIRPEAYTG